MNILEVIERERWNARNVVIVKKGKAIRTVGAEEIVAHEESLDRIAEAAKQPDGRKWMPIETAPKDGTDILVYRKDCGVFIARWTSLEDFLTDDELSKYTEDERYTDDWFYADFIQGGRLTGDEIPTHWMLLPNEPTPVLPEKDGE